MRRRRRSRPLWFPPLGAGFTAGSPEVEDFTGGSTFQIQVPADKTISSAFLPVTFDTGQENELAVSGAGGSVTLADLMSSAWRLRRMVGNVFATYQITGEAALDPAPSVPVACVFSVGAMVLAQDASGAPANQDFPAGVRRDDYTDPWIWRRVWLLGCGQKILRQNTSPPNLYGIRPSFAALADEEAVFANFPRSNTDYGYVAGGPHIDQKTNRVIGPEERLFLLFSTKALPLGHTYTTDAFVTGYFEFRLLGGLAKASNRRNASR